MGDPMTPEQLAELERLEREATPGPWRPGSVDTFHIFVPHPQGLAGPGGERVLARMNEHHPYAVDIALIAAMRNALPSLLQAARRLGEVEAELGRRQAMCIRAGVCERCDGTGNGEPDYVDHVAIPTACESCCGGGSQAFFDGKAHERGYLASCIGTTKERVAESLLDFEPLKLATALTTANARIAELEAKLATAGCDMCSEDDDD